MVRSIPLTTAAVLMLSPQPAAAGYAPAVGSRHPDFTLADTATGKPVSLSDCRGKKVLLIQFASW